jgi:hypothetical protein
MKNHKLKTILFGLGFSLMSQASVADCNTMLTDLMNWTSKLPKNFYFINVTMTSNDNDGNSSATSGMLRYFQAPGRKIGPIIIPGLPTLTGSSLTLYSYRRWSAPPLNPCPAGEELCPGRDGPFDPDSPDTVQITLSKGTSVAANVSLTISDRYTGAKSVLAFPAQCSNGHIYGFKAVGSSTRLYDLTFKKSISPA